MLLCTFILICPYKTMDNERDEYNCFGCNCTTTAKFLKH